MLGPGPNPDPNPDPKPEPESSPHQVRGGARDRFTYLVLAKRAEVAGPPSGADKSMALFSLDDEAGGDIPCACIA